VRGPLSPKQLPIGPSKTHSKGLGLESPSYINRTTGEPGTAVPGCRGIDAATPTTPHPLAFPFASSRLRVSHPPATHLPVITANSSSPRPRETGQRGRGRGGLPPSTLAHRAIQNAQQGARTGKPELHKTLHRRAGYVSARVCGTDAARKQENHRKFTPKRATLGHHIPQPHCQCRSTYTSR
jgi:hypothetical protein